jgi:hypothetical protein
VPERIKYKTELLTFRALRGKELRHQSEQVVHVAEFYLVIGYDPLQRLS